VEGPSHQVTVASQTFHDLWAGRTTTPSGGATALGDRRGGWPLPA